MFAIHVAAETTMALFDVSAATATPTQSIALDRIVPHPREPFSQLTGCSRRFQVAFVRLAARGVSCSLVYEPPRYNLFPRKYGFSYLPSSM